MKNSTPTTLYHYTTMSTLYAILSNIEHKIDEGASSDDLSYYDIKLRATHYKYLNDPTEYNFFVECVVDGLKQYQSSNGLDCKKSDAYKSILDLIPTLIGDACIISLSAHSNDLSMWRTYGGNGSGIAIGFNREKLITELDNGNLKKCTYNTPQDMVNILLRDRFIESTYNQINSDGEGSHGIKLLSDLIKHAPFFKNSCYSSEDEWRIVKYSTDYQFIERAGLIVPYSEVTIPIDCIDEIVIGPCADKNRSKYSLQLMLTKQLRYDFAEKIRITTSDIPYINTK